MRYALATLLVIFLLIVGIVVITGQGDGDDTVPSNSLNLTQYINNKSIVSWTVQGELVGDEEYRSIRITVSSNQRLLEVLSGYNNSVIEQKVFDNNAKAYENFMHALNNVSFGVLRSSKQPNELGACPLGKRYVYTLNDGEKLALRSWSDTCKTTNGNFAGNASTVQRIFQNQIPDYSERTSGVQL